VLDEGIMKNILNIILASFGFILSSNLYASDIRISAEHTGEIVVIGNDITKGGSTLLKLRAANEYGISVNRFDKFDVSGSPVDLINVGNQTFENVDGSAELIVIISDDITLNGVLNLVGPAADILFISQGSNQSISCTECELNNFLRISITVAVAESTFQDNQDNFPNIGKMSTYNNGNVYISGLKAPGAIALDLVAKQVYLSNEINLHQSASKDSFGGYNIDPEGKYTIGTGAVNILDGLLQWDYDQQKITNVTDLHSYHILKGNIRAISVKISSSNAIIVNTTIDTRADLISSVRYKKDTHIPIEGINIQSLIAGIVVNGTFKSNGDIFFSSKGKIGLSSSSFIQANEITLIAESWIYNKADLSANIIKIAGMLFYNWSNIESSDSIEIWAKRQLINQYGGKLHTNNLKMQSEAGVVRNGSRTPYDKGQMGIDTDLLDFNNYSTTTMDPTQIGTYYNDSFTVVSVSKDYPGWSYNRLKSEKTSAKLIANTIEISGAAFENINPYYTQVGVAGDVEVDPVLARQVEVTAEEKLVINTTNYILNSSAMMQVNSETGMLQLATENLVNERYRTTSVLIPNSTTYTSSLSTKTVVFSPPGLILSMGNFLGIASGRFLNNVSYVEIFKDAKIDAPIFHDIGLKNSSNGYTLPQQFSKAYLLPLYGQEKFTLINAELDSLFFVQGVANYTNSATQTHDQIFINHRPMDSLQTISHQYYETAGGFYNLNTVNVVGNNDVKVLMNYYKSDSYSAYINDLFNEFNWWGDQRDDQTISCIINVISPCVYAY